MQFVAQIGQGDQIMPISLEQMGPDVLLRVEGLVVAHFMGQSNEMVVYKPSAAVKGINLIVEEAGA